MLKNLAEYERDTSSAKFTAIYRQVPLAFLPHVSACCWQRSSVDDPRMILTQMGRKIDQKCFQRLGRLAQYHPITATLMA
jgi:hypothetical protein